MDKKEKYVFEVFQSIANGYDSANARISAGLHLKWKKAGVRVLVKHLDRNAHVLDLGCGTGDIIRLLASEREDLHITGIDFSPEMLEIAKKNLGGIPEVELKTGNISALPIEDGTFEGAAMSFALRNTSGYEKSLGEAYRILKSGGVFMCIDSFVPENRLIRPFYSLYFGAIMPIIGGGIKKIRQYRWLAGSTAHFITATELMRLMKKVGFVRIRSRKFLFGACVCVIGEKM